MASFGERSRMHLATVDPRLATVLNSVIEHYDFTIVCGARSKEAQDEAFATGASKVQWPNSKHNRDVSSAVDIAPWTNGIDWKDSLAFAFLAGLVSKSAHSHGVRLRWGGDWVSDGSTRDQSFMDIGHMEIVE